MTVLTAGGGRFRSVSFSDILTACISEIKRKMPRSVARMSREDGLLLDCRRFIGRMRATYLPARQGMSEKGVPYVIRDYLS
jgi:hypothetical protein